MSSKELHYFVCKYCQSSMVTIIKSSRPEQCRCSGSWMRYSHSVPVVTEEEETLFARGRVWSPHAPPAQPDPPRAAGPIPPLLTAEQIEQRKAERKALRNKLFHGQEQQQ